MAKDPVHIFVVENSRFFVELLEYIFTKESAYRFIDFNSGEECLKNMHLEPDIVLLDYALPGISGHQTLLKIKKHRPETSVMMMLDCADEKAPAELLEAGASRCLMKGDGVEEVISRLEDHLKNDFNCERKKPPLHIIKD